MSYFFKEGYEVVDEFMLKKKDWRKILMMVKMKKINGIVLSESDKR